MPKSKESTARITMFNQLKIPFVFTLEASFAGASRGKYQGQHFSLGDLENIGKAVLKALYYTRMAESNRRMLKELAIEAESQQLNEEGGDSDGDGSSSDDNEEEEKNAQAENDKIKKELEEMMVQQNQGGNATCSIVTGKDAIGANAHLIGGVPGDSGMIKK